jgi:type VI secretion system protein VasJ
VKDDREALNAVREDLNSIQDFALAEMGEHAPAFSGLMKALDKILRTLPDPKPSSADDGATTSQPAQEFGPATGSSSNDSGDKVADTENAETEPTGGSGAPTSEDTEIHSDVEATRAVRTAATYFRDQDLTNPIPYRLIRIVRWGQLREEPANDGGTTRLEAPREQRRSYLESLLHEGEYETLVQEAESSFQWETYHFWLDLQRLLASALNALGDPYQSAHDAVLMETALLIRRIPRLPRLTFQEGSPFAGPLTQDWIKTEVEAHPENGGASGSGAGQETERAANKDYREARQHLANGDLEEAVSIMRAGSSEDTSQKDVFHRRLYTAILCLNGNHPAVARPILDALDASIEEYGLDTWNPSLALEVWSCRCRCYTMLAEQATKERRQACLDHAEAAFEKICRMDAEEALSIDRPPLR